MTDRLRSSQPAAEVAAVALTVSDAPAAARFFEAALDFEVVAGLDEHATTGGRSITVRLGSEIIVLHERGPQGRPVPADSRSNDLWFQHVAIVVSDIRAACDRLDALGIRHTSPTPQRLPAWNPDAGGIEASYLRDPDGHPFELIGFPPGKGNARWQSTERLMLGIDHTAIVVSSTEAGLRFYGDGLGSAACPAPGYALPRSEALTARAWSSFTTCRRRPDGPAPPTPSQKTYGMLRPGSRPQTSKACWIVSVLSSPA